jgi:hypothetical protein
METGLAGRTVLITGANNPYGVGAATAKAFAARGAKILLHYFRAESSPGEEVTDSPGEAFYYRQQTKDAPKRMPKKRIWRTLPESPSSSIGRSGSWVPSRSSSTTRPPGKPTRSFLRAAISRTSWLSCGPAVPPP